MKGFVSISKLDDLRRLWWKLYRVGESFGSSFKSLEIVESLWRLRIKFWGSNFWVLDPPNLTSGELELALSFDFYCTSWTPI